jgi:NAD(P)-dependent dehydrogenase (short-subunit alcohol dehydrogenase family)
VSASSKAKGDKEPDMMLKDKVAVVYGAGGAIGGAVAHAFAAEGARVFATGRRGADGLAEVDALDDRAVARHLESVIDEAGRVDVSFNAVGISHEGIVGVPLTELDAERFAEPITAYATSYFLTARAAARHMIRNRSGVIMTVTALPARMGTALNGGYGAAQAAKDALTRDLSLELAPHGIRVVGLRPHGMPETGTMRDLFERKGKASGMTWEQFTGQLATTHPRRVLTLGELADTAVFLASDRASGMTGTTVNLTMGGVYD